MRSYRRAILTEFAEGRRADLAARVRHISIAEGDGADYDIESVTTEGQVKYIEVKTTMGPAQSPFYMSSRELAFAKAHAGTYYVYRVYDAQTNSGDVSIVPGDPEASFDFKATQYRVMLK